MTAASLTTAERISIVTGRRLRALGGYAQLRLVLAALVIFFIIDYVRLTLTSPLRVDNAALVVVMDLVAYASILISLWRPQIGFFLAAIPLATALMWPSTGLDAMLLLVAPALTIAQSSRRVATGMSIAVIAYVAMRAATNPAAAGLVALALGGNALLGLALGWAGLAVRERHERQGRSEVRLAGENARIRADERRTLSRELHDVVAHQLSTASLQIMGARGSDDPATLHRVLGTVDHATSEALTELRLLVRVLRDDPATAASGSEIRELSHHMTPTQSAAEAQRALVEAGFEVDTLVPAQADRLEMTVQRTLGRAIREATSNIIKHAQPRGRCLLRVTLTEQQVTLQVHSELPGDFGDPVLGWGLRGLRERVALTGGTFSTGPDGREWVVALTLPHG